MLTPLALLILGACAKNEKVADLGNDRTLVRNSKSGKYGVEFQTQYMADNGQKPVVELPIAFDLIEHDPENDCYFVSRDDSMAIFTAPNPSTKVECMAQKIADLKRYDLTRRGVYGVPVTLTDGSTGHLYRQRYKSGKSAAGQLDYEDILVSYSPNDYAEYLIAGPYDKMYDGFNILAKSLGGFTEKVAAYYVVERDGRYSIGNSGDYNAVHGPYLKQWFDDLIIVRDPKDFIYLCVKTDGNQGVWDIIKYEKNWCNNHSEVKLWQEDRMTDEQLEAVLAKAESKRSDKVYVFEKNVPFSGYNSMMAKINSFGN